MDFFSINKSTRNCYTLLANIDLSILRTKKGRKRNKSEWIISDELCRLGRGHFLILKFLTQQVLAVSI